MEVIPHIKRHYRAIFEDSLDQLHLWLRCRWSQWVPLDLVTPVAGVWIGFHERLPLANGRCATQSQKLSLLDAIVPTKRMS